MKELWPSSLHSSAKKDREYFENLDPRFEIISTTILKDKINYLFNAKENVSLELMIKDGKKFQDYLKNTSNEIIIFEKGEIEIVGSKLFKEIINKSEKIEFKLQKEQINVEVYLLVEHKENTFLEVIHLDGALTSKNKNLQIECILSNSPFKLKIFIDSQDRSKPTFNLEFDFINWLNKPIKSISHLKNLYNFFTKVKTENNIVVRIDYLGNNYAIGKLNFTNHQDYIDWIFKSLTFTEKLQRIDSYFNLNLPFPDFTKITRDDTHKIEMLNDLILTGEHVVENESITIRAQIRMKNLYFKCSKLNQK